MGFKNYDFKKRTLRASLRKQTKSWATLVSYLNDLKHVPEHLVRDYQTPEMDISTHQECDSVLVDNANELIEMSNYIQSQIDVSLMEMGEMKTDLRIIREVIGKHFKGEIYVKEGKAFKINEGGELTELGKVCKS